MRSTIALPLFAALFLLLACGAGESRQQQVTVAVASNFASTIQELADLFEQETGISVVLSLSSTGKHYAQIVNGAPYDVFLAADAERPRLLEEEGNAVTGTRFTYAIGRLVLWSPDEGRVTGEESLRRGDFRFLSIANPRLAPYGSAAREVLESIGLWEELEPRLVQGENITQAWQFVATGNAELGFVPEATIIEGGGGGSQWIVPQELYTPIVQQAVLIRDTPEARAFLEYLASEPARTLIGESGYDLP